MGPVCYQDCKNFGGVRPPPTPLSALKTLDDENEAIEDGLIPGMGALKGMTGGADPRAKAHEDTEYCYKDETLPRPPGVS